MKLTEKAIKGLLSSAGHSPTGEKKADYSDQLAKVQHQAWRDTVKELAKKKKAAEKDVPEEESEGEEESEEEFSEEEPDPEELELGGRSFP